ncbi:hypothetical protein C6P41_002628 [Kluyveromyces marxianus]|nr:hypothetical protein C6P43_000901 [Kluyveromyces marxianus]KAG0685930.1 hypothetical protein C6P41_002628 [Kluyveromyces marxianus]
MVEDCQKLCVTIDPALCGFTRDDHVIITGNFDNWNPGQYMLEFDADTGCFKVQLPYDGVSETIVCKFVVNNNEWQTLDCFDKHVDNMGHENNIIHCKAWLQTRGANANASVGADADADADIVMEDVELDLHPLSNSVSPSDLPIEQLDLAATISNSDDHDYIHITSRGELSSSEDVELDLRTATGAIDDILNHENGQQGQSAQSAKSSNNTDYQFSHNPIHGLVAKLRHATTYCKR